MKKLIILTTAFVIASFGISTGQTTSDDNSLFYDSHFHLTNYVQKGPTLKEFFELKVDKVR